MKAYERLLKYARIWTTSDEESTTSPTTSRQFDLAKQLVEEMKEIGIEDAYMDEFGYVYGHIPATPGYEDRTAIGFIAHIWHPTWVIFVAGGIVCAIIGIIKDTVEKLMVEEKDCQFLFEDSNGLTFMESETFEQFTMPSDILGDSRPFMTDGMTVYINFIDGKPISVELPMQVVCTVVETEPVVKGQTASSSYKPSVLDNGVRVMVPPFINTGDKIVVATTDATYVERAK